MRRTANKKMLERNVAGKIRKRRKNEFKPSTNRKVKLVKESKI